MVLTNVPYAIGVYTSRVIDPTLWDPQFVDAIVMTLGAWTAQPITGSSALVKQCADAAVGLVMAARISDGDEGPQSSDHIPDWIRIRSGRPLGLTVPEFGGGWDSLALPTGAF